MLPAGLDQTEWQRGGSVNRAMVASGQPSLRFPTASPALETFGLKFSPGGAHISRTMMLQELGAVLASVPQGSGADDYREAILQRNVLGKTHGQHPAEIAAPPARAVCAR